MKMKKWLTILLAVLLACGVFPTGAFAEEQGIFQYEVKEDGTAEITGVSDTTIVTLEIPAELDGIPVTSIGSKAFMRCRSLQSVVIQEGVDSFGRYPFLNCTGLESVSIPDSLVSMDTEPFAMCRKLKTVDVSPDHPVFAVENKALVNRQDHTLIVVLDHEDAGTYTVAQGIREIGGFALDSCLFSSVVLPDSLPSIGNGAFRNCANLTEMIFPEGVTETGAQIFSGCENLGSAMFPDSLIQFGMAVFGNAPALTEVRISPDHPVYEMNGPLLVMKRDQEIISVLNNLPGTYEIPEGIRVIGQMAFQGNDDLAELIVPEGVTEIRYGAFSGCSSLQGITLPASLEEIGENAFESSKGLLIKAPAGSWAEQYARENGYRFEALSENMAD